MVVTDFVVGSTHTDKATVVTNPRHCPIMTLLKQGRWLGHHAIARRSVRSSGV